MAYLKKATPGNDPGPVAPPTLTCSALEVLNVLVSLDTVLPTAFMPSITSVDANDVVDVVVVTGVVEAVGGLMRASSSGTTWENFFLKCYQVETPL